MSAPTDGMPEGNFPGGPQPSPEGPAQTPTTQPGADTLAEMRRQVVTLKAEVDALQIASAHQRRSQWLQSSTILAVVGVLITVSTFFYGERQKRLEEQQADRVELAEITKKLDEYDSNNAEIIRQYRDDPTLTGNLLAYHLAESLVLADRATELIGRQNNGRFTGHEHFAVAHVYRSGGAFTEAHQVATDGLNVAGDSVGLLSLLREMAIIEASMNQDLSLVESHLEEAIEKSERWDEQSEAWSNFTTQKLWAYFLVVRRDCPRAEQHAQAAREHVAQMSKFFLTDADRASHLASIDSVMGPCSTPGTPSPPLNEIASAPVSEQPATNPN